FAKGWDNLPRFHNRLVVTAWGQPGSNRQELAVLCQTVAQKIFGLLNRAFSSSDAHITLDLMGKWARLEYNIEAGPINTLIQVAVAQGGALAGQGANVQALGSLPALVTAMVPSADDGIKDKDGAITSADPGRNPPFPNGNET